MLNPFCCKEPVIKEVFNICRGVFFTVTYEIIECPTNGYILSIVCSDDRIELIWPDQFVKKSKYYHPQGARVCKFVLRSHENPGRRRSCGGRGGFMEAVCRGVKESPGSFAGQTFSLRPAAAQGRFRSSPLHGRGTNLLQPSSTPFNPLQPSSTPFNPLQPPSTPFNPLQLSSPPPPLLPPDRHTVVPWGHFLIARSHDYLKTLPMSPGTFPCSP